MKSWAVATWVLGAIGCGGAGDAAGVGDGRDASETADSADARETSAEASWSTALGGLSGALLSVWSDARELWAVGADTGRGPMVVRGTTDGWEQVDVSAADPTGGHLWWVFGRAEALWIVGERGRVLKAARGAEGAGPTWRALDVGTDATLYGIWGAADDDLWAVGGYVYPRTGPPTIVHLGADGGEVVTLPAGLPTTGTFFKVWGAARDDVWVVGEKGMALHYDGSAWKIVATDGGPRLVTIHGSGSEVVAVGGTNQGVVLEGAALAPVEVGTVSPLNGVFVEGGGAAWAVGMLGQVLRRTGDGWEPIATGLAMRDWHVAWVDYRGDLWVAGGNLLTRLDQGTLARFGPPRDDLPSGEVASPEAVESVEAVEAVEVDDVIEVEAIEEVAEVDGGPIEVIDAEDAVDADDGADADDAVDALEVADTEVDTGDVAVDADGDGGVDGDAVGDIAEEVDAGPTEPFEFGRIDYQTNELYPYHDGDAVDVHHGPQGGIHVEVGVRFPCEATGADVMTDFDLRVTIDGVEVARFLREVYPVPHVAADVCQSYVMPVPFDNPDSSVVAGKTARLHVGVKPPGASWERKVEILLVDTL